MTITEADRTAADVAWDIEPLVDGEAEAGVDALLDEADAKARELAKYRGKVGELDAAGLASLMHELAAIGDLVGRADSYAGLRFSVDTADPANGALIAARRGEVHRDQQRAHLRRARVGRGRRRARRRTPRRRPTRVLPPSPGIRPPLPSAPADRAGGGHPLRQVAHREQRVGAPLLRAHLRDHRRPRRRVGEPRRGSVAAACRPIARCGAPRPRPSPPRSNPGCAPAASCSTRCSSTSRSTTGSGTTTAGSRAAT